MIQQMGSAESKAMRIDEECDHLRKSIEYLQAALIDQRRAKIEQTNAFKREIQMLKEQLNSKTKTNIYRPDFLNQKGPIGDENEMVSQKYLKDQITELQ